MATVDLDRQSIEKRDFPIGRRGYDPAAVDAHLRVLAAEIEELQRTVGSRSSESLASTAGTQVRGILEAAEATAADIERKASEDARRTREEADRDAERTRTDAVQRAQAHMVAVSQAASILLERVESMDGEAKALVEGLRAGAGRLANDLTAMETNMAELYDAAAGRGGHTPQTDPSAAAPMPTPAGDPGAPVREGHSELIPATAPPVPAQPPAAPATPPLQPPIPSPQAPPRSDQPATAGNGDLDGARLIALNMALNGESREDTDRYLAENYELTDRQRLLDEVYAAIEG
jgi:hypothetical protein